MQGRSFLESREIGWMKRPAFRIGALTLAMLARKSGIVVTGNAWTVRLQSSLAGE
jgi:hypothetical protein